MITEEKLLSALHTAIDDTTTEHIKLVDSSVWRDGAAPEVELPTDRRAIWTEPYPGIYIINVNGVRHFKKQFGSIQELFKKAVAANYTINSLAFDVPSKPRLFNFKSTEKTSVAIITMFSPKASRDCWLEFIKNVQFPDDVEVDVILGDNSGNTNVKNLQVQLKSELSLKYRDIHILDLGDPYEVKPEDHYLEMHKHAHVAVNYSILLQEPSKHFDYILKIEDDMEPPEDGFVRLYEQIKNLEKQKKKVACVGGYYRQKLDPSTPCLSMQPFIWGKTPKIEDMQPRLIRVEMQGGGFSLYNCKALQEVLPYRLTFKRPHGNFYMTGWDGSIGEEWSASGWEQYCDGTLFCKHHF
jgi:hypothetical protein